MEAVGAGVERVRPGDAVALLWRPRCGMCRLLHHGSAGAVRAWEGAGGVRWAAERWHDSAATRRPDGASPDGGVVPGRASGGAPKCRWCGSRTRVPPAVAAIAGCAVITGVGAVLNVAGAVAGSSMLSHRRWWRRPVGADGRRVGGRPPNRRGRRRADSAWSVPVTSARPTSSTPAATTWSKQPWPSCRAGWTGRSTAVGRPETLQQSIACLRPGGTAIAVGLARVGETARVPINDLVQRQKRLVGSLYGSANPQTDLPRLFELYLSGRARHSTSWWERSIRWLRSTRPMRRSSTMRLADRWC